MSKIKIMEENLANKIAAGEVVEKTMNVVKELVENSIDAGSNDITINLIDSGVKEVEVIDNGIGMDKKDAQLAFSRHATSKLHNLDELFNIESLGFRGEALPSIASVSNIELKTSNNKEGSIVKINGGKELKIEDSDLIKGTIIKVKDLFYNTPVRLKYLKNLHIELANITDYVNKIALSYPNIKFKLTNNNKVLLETDGSGDLLKVIYQVYGADVTKKMVFINKENDDYNINGYISYPEIARSNRNAITILVNGRVIKNNKINRVITECYHTYIPKGKFPIVVLNIDVDPILIDINIHPTKMDIKFSKFDSLKDLLEKEIANKLKELTLIPSASTRDNKSVKEVKDINKNIEIDNDYNDVIPESKTYEEIKLDFEVNEESKPLEEKKSKYKFKRLIPRGVVFLTYIIAENEDGMYIIDQHAAAERINYEKTLKKIKENKGKTDLLVPVKIELPTNEFIIIKDKFDKLNSYGFITEEFGLNTIIVRSHPDWVNEIFAEECIRKFIDLNISNDEFNFDQFVWRMAATQACRMSIKANDYISEDDQIFLLDELRKCDNPFTCPHGRPTIINYTKYDLEQMFNRT